MTANYLKKGAGQGGGNQSSPIQNKDRKLLDDLKKISELNNLMREGSPKREEADFRKEILKMFKPSAFT